MRLSALRIEAFGCLGDWAVEDLEAAPVVCILGPNGAGKTTLFEFIETALYGFHPATRSAHPRDPWTGAVASGEVELWLDDGSEGVVRRRLPSEPQGQWIEASSESKLGNRPLPACSTVPREMFRTLHALDIDGIASLEGEAWRRIEEKVLGGTEAAGLRTAREAAASLSKLGERLWRPDRRGKPEARRRLEERGRLGDQREAAVARLRREREIESGLGRLEVRGEELEAEQRGIEEELERRRARGVGEARLEALAEEIEEARRVAELPVATEGWISAGARIRDLHREYVRAEEEDRSRVELAASLDRRVERLRDWGAGVLRDPEDALLGHGIIDLAPSSIRAAAAELRRIQGDRRGLVRELARAEDEVVSALEALGSREDSGGRSEGSSIGRRMDPSIALAWGGVALATALAWARWEEGGWVAGPLAGVFLAMVFLGRSSTRDARDGERNLDPLRTHLDAQRRTRDRLADQGRVLAEQERRGREELEVALSGVELAPNCIARIPEGFEEALIGIRDLRVSIDRTRAEHGRISEARRARAERAEALGDRLGVSVDGEALEITEVEGWLERLEAAEERRIRALEARARLKKLFGQQAHLLSEFDANSAGPGDPAQDSGAVEASPTATLERRLAEAQGDELERRSEDARLREELRHLSREAHVDEIDGAIACIDEDLEQLRLERDRLELLASVVEEALARHRTRHQADLLDRASRWVHRITGGQVLDLQARDVDGEPRLFLTPGDGSPLRDVAQGSSRGLREQIYLSLRLALAEHCEGGEALPFLLDEVFVTWDAGRIEGGLEVLREVGRERQLFVFTCRDELASRLEGEAGARVLRLPG